jgi:hypothetical protein
MGAHVTLGFLIGRLEYLPAIIEAHTSRSCVVFVNHEVITLDTTNMCNLFLLFLTHFGS